MKQGLLNVDFCAWGTPCGIALRKKSSDRAVGSETKEYSRMHHGTPTGKTQNIQLLCIKMPFSGRI